MDFDVNSPVLYVTTAFTVVRGIAVSGIVTVLVILPGVMRLLYKETHYPDGRA